jgi:hypothetical protein
MAQQPNPNSIVVTRYAGGDQSQASVIPNDSQNGWTYAGYVSNVNTIVQPIPMNQASGYAIQLHGSGMLSGTDTASISFTPAGAVANAQ